MKDKVIFVNATSATMGGSLTILKQFIENIEILKNENKKYYIFTPINCDIKSTKYFEIVPIKAKSYKDRIIWDLKGMSKWSKSKKIYPDLILSLQNTAVRFGKIKQIIYLHQPLPYAKESRWNPFKKDERKMWFYKYLYKIWIDLSIKKEHKIIVQTKWMKDALIRDGYNKDNIIISRPNISDIDIERVKSIDKDKGKYYLFYPAADYKYKNHNIIIEALNILRNNNADIHNKIKVIFTLSKGSKYYDKVKEYGLEEDIEFIGSLKYEDVLSYYKISDVVLFPSYIETFGLPLIEGSRFGKKILVSDCSYSRELLGKYDLVKFIKYNDEVKWAKSIIESIEKYEEKPKIQINESGWNIVFKLINLEID